MSERLDDAGASETTGDAGAGDGDGLNAGNVAAGALEAGLATGGVCAISPDGTLWSGMKVPVGVGAEVGIGVGTVAGVGAGAGVDAEGGVCSGVEAEIGDETDAGGVIEGVPPSRFAKAASISACAYPCI